jgi:hypothetical protein
VESADHLVTWHNKLDGVLPQKPVAAYLKDCEFDAVFPAMHRKERN